MKKLKKVCNHSKYKPKKRLVFLSLRRKSQRKFKLIPNLIHEIPEILSPHNTTGYLIENNSSSFFPEEEDLNIDLSPEPILPCIDTYSDLLKIENQNIDIKFPNLELELASTAAQSQDLSASKLSSIE